MKRRHGPTGSDERHHVQPGHLGHGRDAATGPEAALYRPQKAPSAQKAQAWIAGSVAFVLTSGGAGFGSVGSLGLIATAAAQASPPPSPRLLTGGSQFPMRAAGRGTPRSAGPQAQRAPTPARKGNGKGDKPDTAAPSSGDPAKDAELKRARDAYASGEQKFKASDYAGALSDFAVADGVKSTPQTARYMAVCEDNLGKFADAVAAYERFLANVPAKLQKEGDEARARVAQIKAMPAFIHVVTTPPGAIVTVDGKPSAAPAPTDVELNPGKHTIHLAADGYVPQDKDLEVTFAARDELRVELERKGDAPSAAAVPSPPVAAEPPPSAAAAAVEQVSVVPAYITAGIAIVAAGVGTYFGIKALSTKRDFDKTPTQDTADSGENQALVADMSFAVALTLGLTSIVLFTTGKAGSAAVKNTAMGPVVPGHPLATAATGVAHDPTADREQAAARKRAAAGRPAVSFSASPIVLPSGAGAGATLRF